MGAVCPWSTSFASVLFMYKNFAGNSEDIFPPTQPPANVIQSPAIASDSLLFERSSSEDTRSDLNELDDRRVEISVNNYAFAFHVWHFLSKVVVCSWDALGKFEAEMMKEGLPRNWEKEYKSHANSWASLLILLVSASMFDTVTLPLTSAKIHVPANSLFFLSHILISLLFSQTRSRLFVRIVHTPKESVKSDPIWESVHWYHGF